MADVSTDVEQNVQPEDPATAVILQDHGAPPLTPIQVLQNIGVRLCGVPPEELSPKKLLASLQEEEGASSSKFSLVLNEYFEKVVCIMLEHQGS